MDCDIAEVLHEYYKGCAFSIRGNDYSTIKWNDRNTISKPSLEEIQSKWDDVIVLKIKMKDLRTERNKLLTQTDRYAITDFPHSNLVVQQTWFDYRQALRDLPTVAEDPANPVWPTAPSP